MSLISYYGNAYQLGYVARDLEIAGPFNFERPKMWIATHRRHLEHRVLERELCLLRHHRHPSRDNGPRKGEQARAVEQDPPA